MSWVYLLLAGASEVLWSTAMKYSQGFSKIGWAVVTVLGLVASMFFLLQAIKQLPFSLAYPIWTGIGAVGAVLVGALLFHDKISPLTWFFFILLLIAIVGIKMTASES